MSSSTNLPTANWIWCSGEERPKNFYLHVRRTFECTTPIQRAEIAVTADSRYRLFVNGTPVAWGPARSDRKWQCLDTWDITGHLRPGRNVVAALVHHYGEWTFAYMLGRGGFLADLTLAYGDGRTEHLGTDSSWLVRPAEAWERALPRMSIQQGFPEVFDARKEFEGWIEVDCDDAGWSHAVVLGPPGMDPWPNLVPREIPAMTETPYAAERVIDSGCVGLPPTGHYVDIHRVFWCAAHGVAYLGTFIWSPENMDLTIRAGSQESLKLWLNGNLVISNLTKRDFAPDLESVTVPIKEGWNTVLAKVVQDEGQWHFGFRLEGEGSEACRYSRSVDRGSTTADDVSPWWILGPIQAESMKAGFDTAYPPEISWDPTSPVLPGAEQVLRWMSAGVSRESQVTAIVMGREPRFASKEPVIRNISGLITPEQPAEFLPCDEQGTYAVIDFGKEVTGFPVLQIEGAVGGEIIDLGYSEVLSGPDGAILSPVEGTVGQVNCDRHSVHYADRYICKPGTQEFRTFDKRAFRYLQLDVRGIRQPLRVGPITLLLSTYPVEYQGQFECSDPRLNRIWEIGRWTVQLNMEDAYTDCPWRERGQWWGDARIQALVNYYAFGDRSLIRYGLRTMGHSQDSEGWTRGIYPTDWSYAILPTFSLIWIISLLDYFQFSGDSKFTGECMNVVEGILDACDRHRAEHGLLRNMPYWLFVDWSGVDSTGESASVNALYHGALRGAVQLARSIGRSDLAHKYSAIAEEVCTGMKRVLWDNDLHCFHENWRDGQLSMLISEQANCWAVAFEVVVGEEAARVMRAITHEKKANVVIGTPYFSFYMLESLAKGSDHAQALEYIRSHWSRMVDWGATTWWENWHTNGSLCHGWSSAPTYFLQAEILGARPLSPGWDDILIEPHPADLTWGRGTIPTPHGTISIEWKNENGFTLRIEVPARAMVRLPCMETASAVVRRLNDSRPCMVEQSKDPQGKMLFTVAEPGIYEFSM
jgi:alpha-L-rhamnosidase